MAITKKDFNQLTGIDAYKVEDDQVTLPLMHDVGIEVDLQNDFNLFSGNSTARMTGIAHTDPDGQIKPGYHAVITNASQLTEQQVRWLNNNSQAYFEKDQKLYEQKNTAHRENIELLTKDNDALHKYDDNKVTTGYLPEDFAEQIYDKLWYAVEAKHGRKAAYDAVQYAENETNGRYAVRVDTRYLRGVDANALRDVRGDIIELSSTHRAQLQKEQKQHIAQFEENDRKLHFQGREIYLDISKSSNASSWVDTYEIDFAQQPDGTYRSTRPVTPEEFEIINGQDDARLFGGDIYPEKSHGNLVYAVITEERANSLTKSDIWYINKQLKDLYDARKAPVEAFEKRFEQNVEYKDGHYVLDTAYADYAQSNVRKVVEQINTLTKSEAAYVHKAEDGLYVAINPSSMPQDYNYTPAIQNAAIAAALVEANRYPAGMPDPNHNGEALVSFQTPSRPNVDESLASLGHMNRQSNSTSPATQQAAASTSDKPAASAPNPTDTQDTAQTQPGTSPTPTQPAPTAATPESASTPETAAPPTVTGSDDRQENKPEPEKEKPEPSKTPFKDFLTGGMFIGFLGALVGMLIGGGGLAGVILAIGGGLLAGNLLAPIIRNATDSRVQINVENHVGRALDAMEETPEIGKEAKLDQAVDLARVDKKLNHDGKLDLAELRGKFKEQGVELTDEQVIAEMQKMAKYEKDGITFHKDDSGTYLKLDNAKETGVRLNYSEASAADTHAPDAGPRGTTPEGHGTNTGVGGNH